MADDDRNRLDPWSRLLDAMARFGTMLLWGLVVVVLLSGAGWYLFRSSDGPPWGRGADTPRTVAIQDPIPWEQVDRDVARAMQAAADSAESHAAHQLSAWVDELQVRIDGPFLDWYFDYWQQQWMGLRSMGYWVADNGVVESVFGEQPTAAERITYEIQEEFAKRVLRPEIAQLRVERIAQTTVQTYVIRLGRELASIPDTYEIPRTDWERYLGDVALMTDDVEGNRRVPITLKAIATAGTAGTVVVAGQVASALGPRFAMVGSKLTTRSAAANAGRTVARLAAKTGAKVGATVGGKMLGVIVGVGVVAWDVWDHRRTTAVERPILRENLHDYLRELEIGLLHEPGTGIMAVVHGLQASAVEGLAKHP